MKRDQAINKVLSSLKKDVLFKVVTDMAVVEPNNYPLQLLIVSLKLPDDEKINNWFTALGVFVVHERLFAGKVLQMAHTQSGYTPLSSKDKRALLDLIVTSSKLTKADAG